MNSSIQNNRSEMDNMYHAGQGKGRQPINWSINEPLALVTHVNIACKNSIIANKPQHN